MTGELAGLGSDDKPDSSLILDLSGRDADGAARRFDVYAHPVRRGTRAILLSVDAKARAEPVMHHGVWQAATARAAAARCVPGDRGIENPLMEAINHG